MNTQPSGSSHNPWQRNQLASSALEYHTDMTYAETTRHLCTAAHIDEKFRDYVMTHIVEEEHKAIGELYGVDIASVLKWCFAGQHRALIRNIVLFVWLLITVIVIFQHFGTSNVYNYNTNSYYQESMPIWLLPILIPVILLLLGILGAAPPVISLFLALLIIFFSWVSFPQILLFFLGAWVIVMIETGVTYLKGMKLTKGRFNPADIEGYLDPMLEARLQTITSNVNTVVYSGYSPFVGAGIDIGGWSFAVDMTKGKQEMGKDLLPKSFHAQELYDSVTDAVKDLQLHNLLIEDKLYVNGQVIRGDTHFLPNHRARPRTQVEPEVIQQFVGVPSQDIRYYKRFRVTSWREELVLSIFIRFVQIGRSLFVETDYLLLTPFKKEYIDPIEPIVTVGKLCQLAGQSFLSSFGLWFHSPAKIFSAVFHDWLLTRKHQKIRRLIREDYAFDYGASSSLREFAASPYYRQHFQRLDKEMYAKIIQRQVLETIISFLDSKNIDTSDLKEQQETILNNGLIVSGGSFRAENLAVGDQAKAMFSSLTGSLKNIGSTSVGSSEKATKSH